MGKHFLTKKTQIKQRLRYIDVQSSDVTRLVTRFVLKKEDR